MKYIIELEETPYTNGYVITENGVVTHEKKGTVLYRIKNIPYVALTEE